MSFLQNLPQIQVAAILMAVFLVIGILIGVAVTSLIAGAKKQKSAPDQEAPPANPDKREILRLVRDTTSGALQVEIQGRLVENTSGLSVDLYEGFLRTAREWNHWLGVPSESVQPPHSPSPVQPEPASVAQPVPQPVAQSILPPPVPPPLPSIPAAVQSVAADKNSKKPARPPSIVEQIDAVLQSRLARNPLPGLTIRLVEDPREGVIVWVNSEKFHGIDSVTDPRALELLRAAVAEWEQHSAPG